MTLLQQESRVHPSAKKAVAHQWKNELAQRCVGDAIVERVQPCFVKRRNRTDGLSERRMSRPELTLFVLVGGGSCCSAQCACLADKLLLFTKAVIRQTKFMFSDLWLM